MRINSICCSIQPLAFQFQEFSHLDKGESEDYGELNITFNILGKATGSGSAKTDNYRSGPKGIIQKVNSSHDGEVNCSSETFT